MNNPSTIAPVVQMQSEDEAALIQLLAEVLVESILKP